MAHLNIRQTITVQPWQRFTPGYPPIFPFNGPNALPMRTLAVATSGVVITLVVDLARALPVQSIAYAKVWLLEALGVDPWPIVRLLGAARVVGRPPRQVHQNLVDLQPGAGYVAHTLIRTPSGDSMSFAAPFTAAGGRGHYLTWDIENLPPFILVDEDGVPITADY
jgi:hypothetical protein